MSFMYKLNNNGLRRDPCGIPLQIMAVEDIVSLNLTWKYLFN